jgi:hypothetical protein
VGHGRELVLMLDTINNPQRFVARAAACPIGHGAEVRLQAQQCGQGLLQQGAISFLGFWGKKLKGNHRAFGAPSGRMYIPNELHDFNYRQILGGFNLPKNSV